MAIKNTNSAWDKVTIARLSTRPHADFYIKEIFDNFIELHGDRCYGDDSAIISGIAYLKGTPVTVIAVAKGSSTKENIKRNFGMVKPEGYRKALRLMKQAEKFKRPVICIVDTPGAFCGVEAEENGQGYAIAQNLFQMSNLKTPIIAVMAGEGGSGGALGLAVADKIFMLSNSIYSVLSPEGFASILWKDTERTKEAAEVMKITAQDLKGFNVIDEIIEEPKGGAHNDPEKMAADIKAVLVEAVKELRDVAMDKLLEKRYQKFRKIK